MTGRRERLDHYGASYRHFAADLYAEIRREAFGTDIGQQSWLTLDELERFVASLALGAQARLLDIGCGAGGPALHIARSGLWDVVGVDIEKDGVANANRAATETGLAGRARFIQADAAVELPFEADSFDGLLSIDVINHLPDRPRVLSDWARLLKPGGKLLFTDPAVVSGPLSSEEITARAAAGYYLFVPVGEDERALQQAGLVVLAVEDATAQLADVASRRSSARSKRADALRRIEGAEAFDAGQSFLDTAASLARDRRLRRLVYLAQKPS
jgi:SAM-dependent methyltransferase